MSNVFFFPPFKALRASANVVLCSANVATVNVVSANVAVMQKTSVDNRGARGGGVGGAVPSSPSPALTPQCVDPAAASLAPVSIC